MDSGDLLTCPYCSFGDRNFGALQSHVETAHARQEEDTSASQNLSDFELAQLLAFEEAGIPSELALPDRPDATARADTKEGARDTGVGTYSPDAENEPWVECFCGERVLFRELDVHSDMHAQESVSLEEAGSPSAIELSTGSCDDENALRNIQNSFSTNIPSSLRNHDQLEFKSSSGSEKRRTVSLKELFLGSPSSSRKPRSPAQFKKLAGQVQRLGKAELGPYAHEAQMPGWLRRMLEDGARVTITNKIGSDGTIIKVEAVANETPNLVPTLARLSDLDRSVQRAFYCSPLVHHVAKMQKEGGFCGYRNIQMLISYIRDASATGHENFQGKLPSIIRLQDLIERAWDMGFNSIARVETGGIRLTRKYIGTPEAQALFSSLNIPCEAMAFSTTNEVDGRDAMLNAICEYFDDGTNTAEKVVITNKPPIYFQHHGHSMTIVGVESRWMRQSGQDSNSLYLVVLDPMFNPSQPLKKAAGSSSFSCSDPARLMKAHRRGETYLSKYKDFELLKLT